MGVSYQTEAQGYKCQNIQTHNIYRHWKYKLSVKLESRTTYQVHVPFHLGKCLWPNLEFKSHLTMFINESSCGTHSNLLPIYLPAPRSPVAYRNQRRLSESSWWRTVTCIQCRKHTENVEQQCQSASFGLSTPHRIMSRQIPNQRTTPKLAFSHRARCLNSTCNLLQDGSICPWSNFLCVDGRGNVWNTNGWVGLWLSCDCFN